MQDFIRINMKRLILIIILFVSIKGNSQKTTAQLVTYAEESYTQALTGGDYFANPDIAFASNGDRQQYYYQAWWIREYTNLWQVTGDVAYVNKVKGWIDGMISNAVVIGAGGSNEGFLGWPSATGLGYDAPRPIDGTSLWEGYSWRHVTTLLRIMKDSPDYRAIGTNQAWYDSVLAFTIANIWNKWAQNIEGNMYRVRAHIASHWMSIGASLDYITNNADPNYRIVWQSISHLGMSKYAAPANNIRSNLFYDTTFTDAYLWNQRWQGDIFEMQDSTHGTDTLGNIMELYRLGFYWTATDMASFASTYKNLTLLNPATFQTAQFIDGTGTTSTPPSENREGWQSLGLFDTALQVSLENGVQASDTYRPYAGSLAYNRFILDGNTLFFPETLTGLIGLKKKEETFGFIN
jgi:hypothetical protein